MPSIASVAATSTNNATQWCLPASTISAQTAIALASESRTIFVAKPTGPAKNAIARDGKDRAADDAAVRRDGAGLDTAVVDTRLLSRGGGVGARDGRPRRMRLVSRSWPRCCV